MSEGLAGILGQMGLRLGRRMANKTKTREEKIAQAQRGEALNSLKEHRGWAVLKEILDAEMLGAQAILENERLDAVALAATQARLRTAKSIMQRIEREIDAAADAAEELERETKNEDA